MADTIVVDTITGNPIVATDQIGTTHYQLVKIALGALDVDNGPVSGSNPLPVILTSGNDNFGDVDVASVLPGNSAASLGKTVDNVVGATDTGVAILAKRVTTPVTVTPANGDYVNLQTDDQGSLRVNVTAGGAVAQIDDTAFTAGVSEVIAIAAVADESATDSVDEGDMGAVRMTLDRKQIMANYAHSAGGWTPYSYISDGTDSTNVKASAGQLGFIMATNTNASARYVKFYNSASAPTLGSGTPVLRCMIPPDSSGFVISIPAGMYFDTGIGFTMSTGAADSDANAVASNEIILNLGYK